MESADATGQLNSSLAGRYVIEREIGKGGMATVYLARDLRHDRKVALKLLLAELGAILGPERFLSEIRVTANLQHPNLLPLFDSGEANGRLFYVMPFVEGESLRHRLDREKQIPVDEAIRIAVACANALDYAHRNGVIHRDFKPENVLLSAGQPVIADFGIALAVSNAGGARITQSGLSLGTPQYMSPEQAAGDREVDGRSDIYALACVLYEMLTGDPPHTGSTVQAVIAKVLVEKPRSARSQRERVPEHVDAAIDRALAKIPADRWATAGQFSEALTDPAATSASRPRLESASASWHAAAPGRGNRVRRALWPSIAIAAVAMAGFALWPREQSPAGFVSFTVSTPATAELALDPSVVVFAPDGRSIVYAASVGGARRLFIRPLDELVAREIRGTDDAVLPFFSPDGKWIAYSTGDNSLYKVPTAGGSPVRIAKATDMRGGAWNADGWIVFGGGGGLYKVAAAGGEPVMVTRVKTARGERRHGQPMFLPDGKTVVFRIDDRMSRTLDRLAVASLDREGHELLGIAGTNPLVFADGTLFFGRPNGLIAAVDFDARRKKSNGEPRIVLDEVSVFTGAAASFASNGSLVYVRARNSNRLVMTDNRATAVGAAGEVRRYRYPRLSPDGRKIAVEVSSTGTTRADIWTYDISSQALSRLTSQASSTQPEWTPDGRYIAYIRESDGKNEAWRVPADGSGQEERLFGQENPVHELTFSPVGRQAVFRADHATTNRDIWMLSLDTLRGSHKAIPLLTSGFNEMGPRISPDGRWLTYISDESGRYEVYVRPFPGPGARVQVSTNGGTEPLWTGNGSRVVYRSSDSFISATLSFAAGASVTAREELFADQYLVGFIHPNYDADRSGNRFVLLQPVGKPEIVVVMNGARRLLSTPFQAH